MTPPAKRTPANAAARKPAAKKPPPTRAAAKKAVPVKAATKKPVAKKPVAKKAVPVKAATKKPAAKKPVAKKRTAPPSGLTVAVTGPTGEIGKPFIDALERSPRVRRVIGMARRGFDPAARGWTKTEYREGDILDRRSVDALVAGADVVVHLAFIINTGSDSSLELETPASLTTLIANLSDRNNSLRDEIFDLRLRVASARDSVASGQGSLVESQREIDQLKIFGAVSGAHGPGISIKIDGGFDDRAMSDLTNELRNAGAEAISVNDVRVGPRSWYAPGPDRTILLDGMQLNGPWMVRAIGAPDVMYVAITRTGGIEGQFELIYPKTRFSVLKESAIVMPAVAPKR